MEKARILQGKQRVHDLKVWQVYFEALKNGRKKFELRKMDRDFRVGDFLVLEEYDNENNHYTGRKIQAIIDFMIIGAQFGVEKDYCCMSITVFPLSNPI